MKTALLICLALAVLTAVVCARENCIEHRDGAPGNPCAGKHTAGSRRLRKRWCCANTSLYPVMSVHSRIVFCDCETRAVMCKKNPRRCWGK
ncbi:hypothetical protein ElyMa_000140300 [Elysia marginata]|uniref:Uncharacterized protein n=1 Tax=Elysia marginata TaxID=1093978 RepID=A0AAV4ERQ2_9GAST|nr:hypothetical protein ElyMa_000140300 [Elysia marginata]